MSNIKITSDYHTHTTYSHGSGSVYDNVANAQKKGLEIIAITDHGNNHPVVGVNRKKFAKIRADIENVKLSFPDTKVMMGIEANIIGMSGAIDLTQSDCEQLDIILAGFHLTAKQEKFSDYFKLSLGGITRYFAPSKRQIARNTQAYINAIMKNKIDIITHLGFRLVVDFKEISKVCADYGTYLELSSRHRTPNDRCIEQVLEGGATFVINSDSHRPEGVGEAKFALNLVEKYGISESRIANCNGKKLVLRSKS